LKCFQIIYPVEYENLKYNFGWYSLKIVTIGNFIYNKCTSIIKNNFILKTENNKYKVTFINDGVEIIEHVVNDLRLIRDIDEPFDIIAYEFFSNMKKTLFFSNKLITDKFVESLKESNFSFLAPQLHLSNKTIPIVFSDGNIYISENELFWPGFAKWYLSSAFCNEKNINLEDEENYIISFIDNNMNTVKIKENEYVILGESDYIIIECIEKDAELAHTELEDIVLDESGPK
jgi:hypothetical protein